MSLIADMARAARLALPTLAAAPTKRQGSATDTPVPFPEVLGIQINRLPMTPAAAAVAGMPAYNG